MSDNLKLATQEYIDDKLSSFTPGPVVGSTCKGFRIHRTANMSLDPVNAQRILEEELPKCLNWDIYSNMGGIIITYSNTFENLFSSGVTATFYDGGRLDSGGLDGSQFYSGPTATFICIPAGVFDNEPAFIKDDVMEAIDGIQGGNDPLIIEFLDGDLRINY